MSSTLAYPLGLSPQDGLPRARRVCARRGRRRLLRGARQHHRGLLVTAALLAAPAPRHLARQAAALPRLLPVRAQLPPPGQGPARSPRRRLGRMTQIQHPETQQEPSYFAAPNTPVPGVSGSLSGSEWRGLPAFSGQRAEIPSTGRLVG